MIKVETMVIAVFIGALIAAVSHEIQTRQYDHIVTIPDGTEYQTGYYILKNGCIKMSNGVTYCGEFTIRRIE